MPSVPCHSIWNCSILSPLPSAPHHPIPLTCIPSPSSLLHPVTQLSIADALSGYRLVCLTAFLMWMSCLSISLWVTLWYCLFHFSPLKLHPTTLVCVLGKMNVYYLATFAPYWQHYKLTLPLTTSPSLIISHYKLHFPHCKND